MMRTGGEGSGRETPMRRACGKTTAICSILRCRRTSKIVRRTGKSTKKATMIRQHASLHRRQYRHTLLPSLPEPRRHHRSGFAVRHCRVVSSSRRPSNKETTQIRPKEARKGKSTTAHKMRDGKSSFRRCSGWSKVSIGSGVGICINHSAAQRSNIEFHFYFVWGVSRI